MRFLKWPLINGFQWKIIYTYIYIYNGDFFMATFDYPKGAAMLYIGFYKLNIGRQYIYIRMYIVYI